MSATHEHLSTQDEITAECDGIKALLLEKNKAYGDSALAPVRVFSKADTVEQIRVRIDDKLSRLAKGSSSGEDVVLDLIGYLVLLRIAEKREERRGERFDVKESPTTGCSGTPGKASWKRCEKPYNHEPPCTFDPPESFLLDFGPGDVVQHRRTGLICRVVEISGGGEVTKVDTDIPLPHYVGARQQLRREFPTYEFMKKALA